MIAESFSAVAPAGGPSLAAYADLLQGGRAAWLLARSVAIAAATAALAALIALPAAVLLERTDLPLRRLWGAALLVPAIIPPYINAIGWLSTFRGVGGAAWCVAIMGLSYFPIILIFTRAGLRAIGSDVEESARLTHPWPLIWLKVTLPMASPHALAGGIVVFILAISNFGVPAFLGVNTYPVEALIQFSAFHDIPRAAAVSMPLVLVSLVLLATQERLMRGREYVAIGTGAASPRTVPLGRMRWLALAGLGLVLAVAVGVPLCALMVKAASGAAVQAAWQTAWRQLLASLTLAAASATLAVVAFFPLSYSIARGSGVARHALDLLTLLPFAAPAVLLGIGLIRVWSGITAGVYGTAVIVVFACVARFSPVAIRAMSASIRQIDPQLEDAANLEQVSWLRRAASLLVPVSRPGIAIAWAVVFILSMGELDATMLVVPPGGATVAIRIETLMHYGAGQIVAALCLMMIAATMIPVAFVAGWLGRTRI